MERSENTNDGKRPLVITPGEDAVRNFVVDSMKEKREAIKTQNRQKHKKAEAVD